MTDYRIEAATKEEWAERALRAEAKLAMVEALMDAGFAEYERRLAKAVEDKRLMHIHTEALAEIKATLEGKSDQPIADIIAGCIEEVAAYRATLAELKGQDDD